MEYTIEELKYPIGHYQKPEQVTLELREEWIATLQALPTWMDACIENLDEKQLLVPYREGGWNIQQVVHHVADSHTNSIIRFKWAMTEDNPTIKAYHEDLWATLGDYALPLEPSLVMLEGIHARLTALFNSFNDVDWNRTFVHPESGAVISLKRNLALYSWHGRHHLAHIAQAKNTF